MHCNELYCSVEVVGVGRDQYFRSSACSSMPSPSILGRDDDHNDDDDDDDDDDNDNDNDVACRHHQYWPETILLMMMMTMMMMSLHGGQKVKGRGGRS